MKVMGKAGRLAVKNVMHNSINTNLTRVLNELAPKRTIRMRGSDQFVNSDIAALKKKRDHSLVAIQTDF